MFDLSTVYRPITAVPLRHNESYVEIEPCQALHPYIRCFWGSPEPVEPETGRLYAQQNSLVVPDTCMDIIYEIDYSHNKMRGAFCALDESAHQAGMQGYPGRTSIFAIRFNVWAVSAFAENPLAGTRNGCFAVENFFSYIKRELEPMLFDLPRIEDKVRAAEFILLRRLDGLKLDTDLLNAVYFMISTCGRRRISEAAKYAGISEKKLERLFNQHTGVPPKVFSSLVRYQLLWQELASGKGINILDAADKYGYCDQAHLINDFRHHHLMTPAQAVEFAGCVRG